MSIEQSPPSHHERHGGLLRTNKGKAQQYRFDDVESAVQESGGRVLYAGAVEKIFAGRHAVAALLSMHEYHSLQFLICDSCDFVVVGR